MEYNSAMKMNILLIHTIRMNHKDITLSERSQFPKNTFSMTKTNLEWQKSHQWLLLPVGGTDWKGYKEVSRVMAMFSILTWVVLTYVHVSLRFVHFAVWKLYLNLYLKIKAQLFRKGSVTEGRGSVSKSPVWKWHRRRPPVWGDQFCQSCLGWNSLSH